MHPMGTRGTCGAANDTGLPAADHMLNGWGGRYKYALQIEASSTATHNAPDTLRRPRYLCVVVVCGFWFVVCGLLFVVCGLWFVVCVEVEVVDVEM